MTDMEPKMETETTALTMIPASALPTIIAADENDILGKLAAKVAAHKPDISTATGRDAIRSLAAEIASDKMKLIRLGKSLTEGWRESTKAVNAECNTIEARMDELKERVRAPLTEFENREKARVAGHEAALAEHAALASFEMAEPPSDLVRARLAAAQQPDTRAWEEFYNRAAAQRVGIEDNLKSMLAAAIKREDEAAELVLLREQEAERQRAEREAEIARQAAERARVEAEAKAAEEAARVAREAAEREAETARVAAEAQAKVEREKAAAVAAAAKAETERLAAIDAFAADIVSDYGRYTTACAVLETAERIAGEAVGDFPVNDGSQAKALTRFP